MKQFMGKSQFNRQLAIFNGHAVKTRECLQELIEDGIIYAMHPESGGAGDLTRLDKVLKAVQHTKALPTRTIQRYIQAHVPAEWKKKDDNTHGFKYKNGAGATMPEKTYWDWEGNTENKAKPEIDIERRIKAMITEAENAVKNGKKDVKHTEYLPELKKLMQKMSAQVHTEEG